MTRFPKEEFDAYLSAYINKLDASFDERIHDDKRPDKFIKELKIEIENKLTALQNANPKETRLFLDAHEIRERKKGIRNFGEAIERVYLISKADYILNTNVLANIISLYMYRDIHLPQKDNNSFATTRAVPVQLIVEKDISIDSQVKVVEKYLYTLFNVIKACFDESEHGNLLKLLKGNNLGKKAIFNSNANKLTDIFWFLLQQKNVIINAQKNVVEKWICDSFQYRTANQKLKDFDYNDVHKSISSKERRCKKPIKSLDQLLILTNESQ